MTNPKPKNLVQTIERTAFILDIIGRYPNGLSLEDLALEANLPEGTTHRLVSSLASFDFIRQDPVTVNYHLGFKLADLENLLLSRIDLRSKMRFFLIELSETVKETDGSPGCPGRRQSPVYGQGGFTFPTTRITMERIEAELKYLVYGTASNISVQRGHKDMEIPSLA
jgi:hypothetical protein